LAAYRSAAPFPESDGTGKQGAARRQH